MRRTLSVAVLLLLRSYTTALEAGACPKDWEACKGIGEPFLMCCPIGSTCIGLANNNTKICCRPDQFDCLKIGPIACDLQLQNSTTYRNSMLSTNLLDSTKDKLEECVGEDGNANCCPSGFTCKNKFCVRPDPKKASNTTSLAISSSSSPSSPPSAATSSVPTSAETTSTSPASSATALPVTKPDEGLTFPAPAILVGFFPGFLLGVFITLATLCCVGSKRRKGGESPQPRQKVTISSPHGGSEAGRSEFTEMWKKSQQTRSQESTPALSHQAQSASPPVGLGRRMTRQLKKTISSGGANAAAGAAGLGLRLQSTREEAPSVPRQPTWQSAVLVSQQIYQEPPPVPSKVAYQAATPSSTHVAPLNVRRASRRTSTRPEGHEMQHLPDNITISLHGGTLDTLRSADMRSDGSHYNQNGGIDGRVLSPYAPQASSGPPTGIRNSNRNMAFPDGTESNGWPSSSPPPPPPRGNSRPTTAMSGTTQFEGIDEYTARVSQNGYLPRDTLQQEQEQYLREQRSFLSQNFYTPSRTQEGRRLT